jgi:hypothetical protein
LVSRAGVVALLCLPAGLTLYLSVRAGGFFPNTEAVVVVLVAQALVLRTTLAEDPTAGFNRWVVAAGLAIVLYTLLTVASGLWSHAPARAFLEYDRALLYALVFILFASVARRSSRLRWMVRALAAALLIVCLIALATRLLPDVWPISPGVENNRLSYPLTYWNALGLAAVLGALLSLHLTTSREEPRAVRILAAAGLPIAAVTLYFTFSRGAIAALIPAVIIYLALVRGRGLLSALFSAVPATVVAVIVAYHADLLATAHPTTQAAIRQGHHVAVVGVLCVAVAIVVRALLTLRDEPVSRIAWPKPSRPVALGATGAVVVALVAGALALHVPATVSSSVDSFLHTRTPKETGDFRDRFISPSSSYRVDHWRIALDEFRRAPVFGRGAGTYELTWNQHRPVRFTVLNAHSLYFETLSDLGATGLLLLVGFIVIVIVGLSRRLKGPNRRLYACVLATSVAWVFHAGVDWDWQMPAVSVWFFALGGAALASRAPSKATVKAAVADRLRLPVAIGWLVVAVAPLFVLISERQLQDSVRAFDRNECPLATRRAVSSIATLSVRPEPYEIVGYCDLATGYPSLAILAMRKAIEQDPDNWEYRYALALAQGAARRDPRPDLARARELNPRDVYMARAELRLRSSRPDVWEREAARAGSAILASGKLAISPH